MLISLKEYNNYFIIWYEEKQYTLTYIATEILERKFFFDKKKRLVFSI